MSLSLPPLSHTNTCSLALYLSLGSRYKKKPGEVNEACSVFVYTSQHVVVEDGIR